MQELEKILEEIDEIKVGFDTECRSECDLYDWSCGACVGECDEYIKERAKGIIRKHMNDGWIPVEDERKPREYETVLCVTNKRHYFVGVYNQEYGFRTGDIEAEGEVIAWQPLPEPYIPKKGAE